MTRLIPDSVVGRTALVLVAALALSLGVALFVFAGSRSEALAALGGRNAAERVAALVALVEETPPEARRHVLRRMDSTGFRAGWGANPLVGDTEEPFGLAKAVTRDLAPALDGRQIRVAMGPPPPGPTQHPQGMGMGGGPGGGFGLGHGLHGPALRISVRLHDGSWLNVFAPLDLGEPLWGLRFLGPVVAALLAVTLAALWAVRRATRPFATFAAAAERLGLEITAPPVPETGPREVRKAAHAFNVMQGRIRRFVDDRTQMLAAISHDLRTPITRLKLRAEFIDDEDERSRLLADLDEMERMIAATLSFAKDDALREDRRPVDVAALVQGLAEDLGGSYDGPDRLVIEARPTALKRAVANLIENAVKYGGTARCRLEAQIGQTVLTVADDGPGIPEAEFERVFAPFVRLEASRNRDTGGTGLGLAVARAAIRAHGGDVILSNRPEGGLTVTAQIPNAPIIPAANA
ncbi:ATP-binding protein [Magnetospirillum moscoviense]|uniref:ATP-binding protein n=1 Tax=Magnetospirillum moscoviense TaxID=1437059 RepID=UPI0008391891|nr:ATP-binding protein [Magnetospirillum moscoviense]